MLASWIRALVLIAVGALLAGVQCSGNCVTACGAQTPAGGCHHQKSSHEGQAGCLHQHSEFTGPESAVAKASNAQSAPIVPLLTRGSTALLAEPALLLRAHTESPPDRHIFPAVSILRI
jgi:hypothetical protein